MERPTPRHPPCPKCGTKQHPHESHLLTCDHTDDDLQPCGCTAIHPYGVMED